MAIGVGASFGALVRFTLTSAIPLNVVAEVIITLTINIVACYAMGLFDPPPFWGKGLLGGLSTFSAPAHTAARIYPISAAAYIAATMFACVIAWVQGNDARRRRAR
nr:CrcB family protein [Corynebacterium aquatimens]